jgi:hypothetical protein
VTCIDYANACPAQPDLIAGDVCSAQFDVTVAAPPSTTTTGRASATAETGIVANQCYSLPREDCELAAPLGCSWNDQPASTAASPPATVTTPVGVCVCTAAADCVGLLASTSASTTTAVAETTNVAPSAAAVELCVADQSTPLLDAPCSNKTVAMLAVGDRILLVALARVDDCSSTAFVQLQTTGQQGYASIDSFTSDCMPAAVADDPAAYVLAALLALAVVALAAVAAVSCWFVRRRRRRGVPEDDAGNAMSVSPYGQIPPASPYAERVSIASSPSPYANLSATEIGK